MRSITEFSSAPPFAIPQSRKHKQVKAVVQVGARRSVPKGNQLGVTWRADAAQIFRRTKIDRTWIV